MGWLFAPGAGPGAQGQTRDSGTSEVGSVRVRPPAAAAISKGATQNPGVKGKAHKEGPREKAPSASGRAHCWLEWLVDSGVPPFPDPFTGPAPPGSGRRSADQRAALTT